MKNAEFENRKKEDVGLIFEIINNAGTRLNTVNFCIAYCK
jgi:hypothetical protein